MFCIFKAYFLLVRHGGTHTSNASPQYSLGLLCREAKRSGGHSSRLSPGNRGRLYAKALFCNVCGVVFWKGVEEVSPLVRRVVVVGVVVDGGGGGLPATSSMLLLLVLLVPAYLFLA